MLKMAQWKARQGGGRIARAARDEQGEEDSEPGPAGLRDPD